MKTKLLIIILVALILVACVEGDDNKTEIREPITLQETGIHRYIDTELGIACYTFRATNVSFTMSCVSIDKGLGDG